jgi:hypothetical protein
MEDFKPTNSMSLDNQGQLAKEVTNTTMVSQYEKYHYNKVDRNLLEIFEEIKSGAYKVAINNLRTAKQNGDDDKADRIKGNLVAFSTSGTFGEKRSKQDNITYSQIVCIDFDHIPNYKLLILRNIVDNCLSTFASFISPSGDGLKVFVKVDSNAESHTIAYNEVANYYKDLSGNEYDPKCKDITRLCFVSYDPELFLNVGALIYEYQEEKKTIFSKQKELFGDKTMIEVTLKNCREFTEKMEHYSKGNRNNFVYLFSCNANKYGLAQDDVINYCISNFDLGESEIHSAVKSAYENQIADFARFASYAEKIAFDQLHSVQKENEENESEIVLTQTPIIPQTVYEHLPSILKRGSEAFEGDREKDVFLTGALAIISGCLPNVTGVYSRRTVYPQLFCFIVAPAASGKGALQSSKELADVYHYEVLKKSEELKKEYKQKMDVFNKKNKKTAPHETIQSQPKEPPFKVVFIPANTSNAKIIQHLQSNNGVGIICETEADTLGNNIKNDWGVGTDLLRKAFHHEKISISRKTENEYSEINNPQLAVVLSGTPKQVFNIISSTEDGLFSRFIFYSFKSTSKWLDPSPYGNQVNLTEHFKKLGDEVYDMVKFLEEYQTVVSLSKEQWDKLNPLFAAYLSEIRTFVSEDADSIVKRLGLVSFRICMILTSIRKYENRDKTTKIECLDQDFESALSLIEVYLQHSVAMFNNLPKQETQGSFKAGANKKLFFDALPTKFSLKEAIELGLNFDMQSRTVSSFLNSCLGNYLHKPKFGNYEKLE